MNRYFILLLVCFTTFSISTQSFRICAGSFGTKKGAENAINVLQRQNYQSYTEIFVFNGTEYHRVFLKENFTTYKIALDRLNEIRDELIKMKFTSPWVVSPDSVRQNNQNTKNIQNTKNTQVPQNSTNTQTPPKTQSNQTTQSNPDKQTTPTVDNNKSNTETVKFEEFKLPPLQETKNNLANLNKEAEAQKKELNDEIKNNYEEKKSINETSSELIKLHLQLYKEENNKMPDTEKEFSSYISDIPNEIISGSNRISFTKDSLGGWYVDREKLKVEPNLDDELLK